MDQTEADEWRRRILARQQFLELETDQPSGADGMVFDDPDPIG